MKLLPLSQLPDFPKAEYWALIYELAYDLENQQQLQERNHQLEQAWGTPVLKCGVVTYTVDN